MPLTILPTQDNVEKAMRSYLSGVLAAGVEVVKGQVNRVPEPKSRDFVIYWWLRSPRLSTNLVTYDGATVKQVLEATQVDFQIDVHGPHSTDNARIISQLFRDQYGVDAFAAVGFDVAPLYADDPRQLPFVNGEQQYEDRWVVEASLQVNGTIADVPQQQATTYGPVTIIAADVEPNPAVASFVGACSAGMLIVDSMIFGEITVGAPLSGPGVPAGTLVTESVTGEGGAGVYAVNTLEAIPGPGLTTVTFPV